MCVCTRTCRDIRLVLEIMLHWSSALLVKVIYLNQAHSSLLASLTSQFALLRLGRSQVPPSMYVGLGIRTPILMVIQAF